jgi:hypothetical protein
MVAGLTTMYAISGYVLMKAFQWVDGKGLTFLIEKYR